MRPVRIPQEHDRTRYNKLVFFHSVRIPEIVRWDTLHRTCVSASGGICGSRGAFRCVRGTKRRLTIAHARVGWVRIPQKARWDTVRRTCLSTSSGICGSHSALRSIRGAKCRHTIFHAWVGPVRIPKEARRDMICQTCVLHPTGSVGHLVHCVASSMQNIDALLLMPRWDRYGFHKKGDGTRYTRLVSLHPVRTIFHVVH
jgi:hypothetical protein